MTTGRQAQAMLLLDAMEADLDRFLEVLDRARQMIPPALIGAWLATPTVEDRRGRTPLQMIIDGDGGRFVIGLDRYLNTRKQMGE